MEQETNWKIILRSALPVAVIMVIVFYTNIGIKLKWFYLVLGLIVTYFIVYFQDKKKHNVFTAIVLVLMIALITYGLKNLGLF